MSTQKRSTGYYSRITVPTDLRETLGRREVVKCLDAADHRIAKLRCSQWEARVALMFHEVRVKANVLTKDQLDTLVSRYLSAKLDDAETTVATLDRRETDDARDGAEFALQDAIEKTEHALRWNDFSSVVADARTLLAGTGAAPAEDSPEFLKFCRRLLEAKLQALWAELRGRQGQPMRPASGAIVVTTGGKVASPTLVLSQAFAQFNKQGTEGRGWRAKTAGDHATVQATLLEVLGDRPVSEVTKADLLQWLDAIRQLPADRSRKFPGMIVPAILAAIQGRDDVKRLDPKSINARYLSCAKAFFAWAAKADMVERDPAVVLEPLKLDTSPKDDRAFTDAEVATIFAGAKQAAQQAKRPGYYWLALLALYTGARRDELAGLRVADVREVEGAWCIDINRKGPRDVKNDNAVRLVPIHSRVIALGFLDYVRALPAGGLLVPTLRPTKDGKWGGAVGSWFNGYIERIGVKRGREQDFHSLRHTWATALKRAGVSDSDRDELGGWARTGSSGSRIYAKGLRVPQLAELIERLNFPL